MKKVINTIRLGLAALALLVLGCKPDAPSAAESEPAEESRSVEIPEGTHSDLVVDLSDTGISIQPTMYGIFFEDINFAGDGGLYAELIKNRSFEFPEPRMGWEQPNSVNYSLNEDSGFAQAVTYSRPHGGNKRYSHIIVHNPDNYSLLNTGFRGIGIKKDQAYDLSVRMGNAKGIHRVRFALVDSTGATLAATDFSPDTGDWKSYEAVLTPSATEAKAQLKITFEGEGSLDMDMVSLFPQDTWKGRKQGLRKDLVELLDGMQPGFLRFPGGCIVEGRTLAKRYQWQKTVGPPIERELLVNRWNTEFDHRPTPDYYQSFGLGFFEYFQLAEDLGAEPMPILGCGMACQFNTGELVPLENLQPYVQEALDLVEFANGDINTHWGRLRAQMGHPEPFHMKYLGIGNEQWGPEYFERYDVFAAALAAKHPEIILISTPGPFPQGDMFEFGWKQMKQRNVPIADEHFYQAPEWFRNNATRYDDYDRNGPKVFAGEYAAQSVSTTSPENENNWECALAEAAFMTGLERNADVVVMTSYAPLMAHAEGWQWTPDLIWFNNLEAYGTPNYYVQQLFSTNAGTELLQVTEGADPLTGQHALYATATRDGNTGELIVKLVNTATSSQTVTLNPRGGALAGEGSLTVLKSGDLKAVNSFSEPQNLQPETGQIRADNGTIDIELAPQSVNVVRIAITG